MNKFNKIGGYLIAIMVLAILFFACEKDDRPVFSSSSPIVAAESNSQFVGEDKTILIYDTFQVSFTVTPGDGNVLDEVIIERILNGIKTNHVPDSQPYGNSYRYIDEFIADSVTNTEQFRFTFIDNRENQITKIINIKTATILRDSSSVATIFTSAARDSGSLKNFSGSGYPIGWDLTNETQIYYNVSTGTALVGDGDSTRINVPDSTNMDIISYEAPGSFNGGFTSLNGRKFAIAPSSWQLDSITDRNCEELYNHKSSVDSLFTEIPSSRVGNVYVTKLPGFVEYQVIKITEVDGDFNPYTPCLNPTECFTGALSFKTIKKLN